MGQYAHYRSLSKSKQDFCSYAGTFGVLIGLTCLVQHTLMKGEAWATYLLAGIYIFSIVAFLMFGIQHVISPGLLVISSSLIFFAEMLLIVNGIYSLIVLVFLIYALVITIYSFVEGVPKLLKLKAQAIREEEQEWSGKI
jgi:predicted membrane protein